MDNGSERRVIAVVRDLFFSIRIKETLQAHGYAVAVANSPQALTAALADAPTALIILDLNFRGIDPPATIARLKADPASGAIPALAARYAAPGYASTADEETDADDEEH